MKHDETQRTDVVEESKDHKEKQVIVKLKNVHKTYLLGVEGVAALRGINLEIYKGEWIVIYGTSGGGKSSLLNLIGTIDKPTRGEISICGVRITSDTDDDVLAELRLNKLGFVFQTFNLLGNMSASENVELPMILKGEVTPEERSKSVRASLTRVGLAHRLDQFPNQVIRL
jgi:putative ABC transport system ATP-binding protein